MPPDAKTTIEVLRGVAQSLIEGRFVYVIAVHDPGAMTQGALVASNVGPEPTKALLRSILDGTPTVIQGPGKGRPE